VLRFSILGLYLLSAWLLVSLRNADLTDVRARSATPAILSGFAGLALHALLLARLIPTSEGPDLSIANVLSLVGIQIALVAVIAAFVPRFRGLGATLLPVAGVAALASGLGDLTTEIQGLSWEMKSHIAISVLAYTLLSVGALIAVLVWLQDRALRRRQRINWVQVLPPMESMEQALFMTIHAGVILLTLSVFSGLIFVDNVFAQHLVHKTLLSILALIVFGILLVGRWRMGWRGRRAIHWTLTGYAALALGYFGSRVVLEVLLNRQWG
jgi:ABC-type uncharacterized transport system permease subunit